MKKKVTTFATAALLSSAFAASASANTYTVQQGDTLYGIANKYNTSIIELKKINSLNSDLILVNQKLKVLSAPAPASATKPAPPPAPAKTTATTKVKTYTVVSGDTPIKIANKHGISLAELNQWNGLKSHIIYPGQKLVVSKTATAAKTTPAPAPAPAPATRPAAPPPPAAHAAVYTVKKGDTLGKIALQYRVTVSQLKSWNKLSSDLILIGQKLKVSAAAAAPVAPTPAPAKPSPAPAPAPTPAKPEAFSAAKLIAEAQKLVGTPYLWAGSTPSGFDCSGFMYYVFNQAGKKIDRHSSQGYYDRSYYVDKPMPGDLVFFENTYQKGISHMGIYIGANQFIHADSSGVRVTDVNNAYYKQHFESFKRFY